MLNGSLLCNYQELEATQMSHNKGINKYTVVQPCNEIILLIKKQLLIPITAWAILECII